MLEHKIEKLTETLERLIKKLDSLQPQVAQAAVEAVYPVIEKTDEEVKAHVEQTLERLSAATDKVDREALKSETLRKVRENSALKAMVKEILAAVGAKTLEDVADKDIGSVKAKIEAL